ncbi:MAG: hypothetical protein OFPI_02010 [Osedax symbiont Rs2]|nr:MAG: hypothetical protein OFPI_02010 [Osedax symbiont Rs2]
MSDNFQCGTVADASSNALFVTLNSVASLSASNRTLLLSVIQSLPEQLAQLQADYPQAQLQLTFAISSGYWDFLALADKPAKLQKFKAIRNQVTNMPATDSDMLLHIRSCRHDLNYHFALQLFEQLKPFAVLDEMVHGFRYLDSRDFTGFVDGTENPQGEARKQVALVADDELHNGASYIHLQKYHHDLSTWQQLSERNQEDSYGRSKIDNVEYPAADKLACAHTKRSAIKDTAGKSLEILRHSLPFGDLQHSGLLFASYCANPDNFNLMLQSMCHQGEAGECDKILTVTSAITGHAFFAANLSWFKNLSEQ